MVCLDGSLPFESKCLLSMAPGSVWAAPPPAAAAGPVAEMAKPSTAMALSAGWSQRLHVVLIIDIRYSLFPAQLMRIIDKRLNPF
jgi:hypothetical protein